MTRWKNGVQADMSDYIKREDAKEYLYRYASEEFSKRDMKFAGRLTAMQVEKIPSADVAPVRHGHWIEDQDRIVCSECGARFKDEIIYMQENKTGAPHQCLECGAIMDQEVKECLA